MIQREVLIGPSAAPVARLLLGDAYAIRPKLGWMDADVMDPPYVIATSGGGHFRATRQHLNQITAEGLDKGFDHAIIDPTHSGAVVVFCHNDQLADLIPAVAEAEDVDVSPLLVADMFAALRPKFRRVALCVWIKPNPSPMRNKHYLPDLEPYVHAWNKGFHPVGEHAEMKRHIVARPRQSKEWGHPTVKPDAVMAKIIANVAGRTVCDPFMGTGSTGVAAIRAGRHFTGIEHNPAHFETAVKRLTDTWRAIEAEAATKERAA